MNREQAKEYIKNYVSCTDYLEKSKGNMYCCPHCGSGKNENKTGAVKYNKNDNTYHCFSANCQEHGDIIKLYQTINGIDFNTALDELATVAGIEIDKPQMIPSAFKKQNTADYTEYYEACRKRLNDPEAVAYLEGRGISLKTAELYGIGYDPQADPAAAPGAIDKATKYHPTPRIIVPTDKGHYVARRIDGGADFRGIGPKDGSPGIFNLEAVYKSKTVFVFEGVFDALSVLEAGYPAAALSGCGNGGNLLAALKQKSTEATIILCPDNDSDPEKAARVKAEFNETANSLKQIDISCIVADVNGKYKDANEHFTQDREGFLEVLEEVNNQPAKRPDNTSYYIDNLMAAEIEEFKLEKKTGFRNLDEASGGLYTGLYVLAAVPSLGKTSFALQMADQLAEAGNDVIYFSLEQSKLELVTKSLARITRQQAPAEAIPSLAIRKGYFGLNNSVLKSAEIYKERIGDRLSIKEGNFGVSVTSLSEYTKNYIAINKVKPVVIVDYLQILQPIEDRRQTTKEVIDTNITELKRMSRDLNLTVIVISSVNRSSYLSPVSFEALKESGAIEFGADVIWGLQLKCINDEEFSDTKATTSQRERIKEEKKKSPREMELVCLKNRFGISDYSCYFNYYSAHDLFEEQRTEEQPRPWYEQNRPAKVIRR